MLLPLGFILCVILSAGVIRCMMGVARRFNVLDHPGGHKQHDNSTPFVGGSGVIAVVLVVTYLGFLQYPELSQSQLQGIGVGAGILFLTGFADDIWSLNFKTRFFIQALVAISMVSLGNVELLSLGEIFPGVTVELGSIGIPFTILATVGLINALNMIDGIDGLSGSISFISLCGTAIVAALAQNATYLVFIIAVMGGVAGFLYYNLRYPTNQRARVFLGDNGSMLLGFVFAWLFIALSQGERAAMVPVTALWLFAIPLLDTVSVMLRRIWIGHSPFRADRNHLHHLFLRAGFRVSDTVAVVALFQVLLVAIGLAGEHFGVPEYFMFGTFLGVFAVYFYVIVRPWRFVSNLRRLNALLGLPSAHARGVFIGYFKEQESSTVLHMLNEELGEKGDYRVSLHEVGNKPEAAANIYALLEIDETTDDASVVDIRRLAGRIETLFAALPAVHTRLFMNRDAENGHRGQEERRGTTTPDTRKEQIERRSPTASTSIYASAKDGEANESTNPEV